MTRVTQIAGVIRERVVFGGDTLRVYDASVIARPIHRLRLELHDGCDAEGYVSLYRSA